MSNRQRIKRRSRNDSGRGTIVPANGHHLAPAMTVSHHCAGCGRQVDPPQDPRLPRLNPQAEAIQAHITDLRQRLIDLAVADFLAVTPEQAKAFMSSPASRDVYADGFEGDFVRQWIYDHYADDVDTWSGEDFDRALSDALDEAAADSPLVTRAWAESQDPTKNVKNPDVDAAPAALTAGGGLRR